MMNKSVIVAIAILAVLIGNLAADTVVLKTGKSINGKIVSESGTMVIVEIDKGVLRQGADSETITVMRTDIASIHYEDLSNVAEDLTIPRDPDYNSLMFCPTPATLPKGDFYFRDFELYFINFGWGVGESTTLSFMTHFPVVSVLDFGAIGFKQRILDREKYPVGLALAGSFSFVTEDIATDNFFTGSLILGVGDRERSFNLVVNQSYAKGEDPFTTFILGGDIRVSRRSKFLLEYMNATMFLDGEFNGFFNFGVRFFGNDWSFSLTGLRALEDTGPLMFIPMIMFSYHTE